MTGEWVDDRPTDIISLLGTTNLFTPNVANVSQRAALAAVAGGLEDVISMRESFDRRRKIMTEMLSEIEGVGLLNLKESFLIFQPSTVERSW